MSHWTTDKDVVVIPYQDQWPKIYALEAAEIMQALGDNCEEIHHIGSTSVVGLSAKPIIDIIPVVTDLAKVGLKLIPLGYQLQKDERIPFRLRFEKINNAGVEFKVMIFEKGNPEIPRLIGFRNHLRQDPQLAKEYEKLKLELASHFPNDLDSYTKGKSTFIQKVDAQAGTDLPRIVHDLAPFLTTRCHELLGPPKEDCEMFRHFLLVQALRILAVARISLTEGKGKIETAIDLGEECHKNQLQLLVERWAKLENIPTDA